MLAYWLERAPPVAEHATVSPGFVYPSPKVAQITWDLGTNSITPDTQLPQWVHTSKLVAKPDQLIKRRGKSGLLLLNKEWDAAKQWIQERAGKEVQVSARPSHLQDSLRFPNIEAQPAVHASLQPVGACIAFHFGLAGPISLAPTSPGLVLPH